MDATTYGLDVAKRVFQLLCEDSPNETLGHPLASLDSQLHQPDHPASDSTG